MRFYRGMIVVGTVMAALGLITLIFQATLFIVFQVWYSFSILDILQRFDWRDALDTGVVGFDDAVDWVLGVPLPIALLILGALIGLIGYKLLLDEEAWHRFD
jgi:hypothetical protein